MADKSPDFKVGEYGRGAMLESVELAGAIAAGDVGKPLKPVGVNTDDQLQVELCTDKEQPRFVAIIESVGAVGDIVEVLCKGPVKIAGTGTAIAITDSLAVDGGLFVKYVASDTDTTRAMSRPCGFPRVAFASGDTGLAHFDGTVN